jgi:hypothetical protein
MSLKTKAADMMHAAIVAGLQEAGLVAKDKPPPRPPQSFFVWARAQVKACENSGWGADQYVDAGFTLRQLRQYLANTGEL